MVEFYIRVLQRKRKKKKRERTNRRNIYSRKISICIYRYIYTHYIDTYGEIYYENQ